jgi:hypothetical protein
VRAWSATRRVIDWSLGTWTGTEGADPPSIADWDAFEIRADRPARGDMATDPRTEFARLPVVPEYGELLAVALALNRVPAALGAPHAARRP